MKNTLKFLSLICIITLFISSCTKTTPNNNTNTTADPNAKQHNEDVNSTKTESDNSNTDVNSALSGTSGFGKTSSAESINICGATIDSSLQHAVIPTLTITFDGTTPCNGRIRSGTVKVELIAGHKWADVGAELRLTYSNYKIIFTNLNNHYITFNGIKYLTNVNGYDELTYLFTGTLTAQLRERTYNMMVTFENGQTSSWNSARLTTWAFTGYTNIAATVNGDTTIAGKTIDSWGVTRFGTNFTTEMVEPWKSGTTCGWWKPTAGKYTSKTDNFSVTATFGLDKDGNPAGNCPGYFKLSWAINSPSSSGETVLGYYY